MNHDDALKAMVTAEPAELRGEAATRLALHIRECERCRATARGILAEEAELDAALSAPPRSADDLADAVLAAAAAQGIRPGEASDGGIVPLESKRQRPARRRMGWTVAVLAAVLAALLLVPRDGREWRAPQTVKSRTLVAAGEAVISAPEDRNVAVIQTRNPDIKVVWFYQTETGGT